MSLSSPAVSVGRDGTADKASAWRGQQRVDDTGHAQRQRQYDAHADDARTRDVEGLSQAGPSTILKHAPPAPRPRPGLSLPKGLQPVDEAPSSAPAPGAW